MHIITSLWLSALCSPPNAEVRPPWRPQAFNSTIWENTATHLSWYLPRLCFLFISGPLADWFSPGVALLTTPLLSCLSFIYSQLALAWRCFNWNPFGSKCSCDSVGGGSLTNGDTWCRTSETMERQHEDANAGVNLFWDPWRQRGQEKRGQCEDCLSLMNHKCNL